MLFNLVNETFTICLKSFGAEYFTPSFIYILTVKNNLNPISLPWHKATIKNIITIQFSYLRNNRLFLITRQSSTLNL